MGENPKSGMPTVTWPTQSLTAPERPCEEERLPSGPEVARMIAVAVMVLTMGLAAACGAPEEAPAAGAGSREAVSAALFRGYVSTSIPIQPFAASQAGLAGNYPYGGPPAFYAYADGSVTALAAPTSTTCYPKYANGLSDAGVIFGTCFTPAGVAHGLYWPSPTATPVLMPTFTSRGVNVASSTVYDGNQDPVTGELHVAGTALVNRRGTVLGTFGFTWSSLHGYRFYAAPGPSRINATGDAVSQERYAGDPVYLYRPDGTTLQLVNSLGVKDILEDGQILTGSGGVRVLNLDGSIAQDVTDFRLDQPLAMGSGGRVAGEVNGPGWTWRAGAFQALPLPGDAVAGDYLKPVAVDACGTIVSAVYGSVYALGWGKGGAITHKLFCDLPIVIGPAL